MRVSKPGCTVDWATPDVPADAHAADAMTDNRTACLRNVMY
jgi:hypothetical protein